MNNMYTDPPHVYKIQLLSKTSLSINTYTQENKKV